MDKMNVVAAIQPYWPCSVQLQLVPDKQSRGKEDASTVFSAHGLFWLVSRVTVAVVGGSVAFGQAVLEKWFCRSESEIGMDKGEVNVLM